MLDYSAYRLHRISELNREQGTQIRTRSAEHNLLLFFLKPYVTYLSGIMHRAPNLTNFPVSGQSVTCADFQNNEP